MTEVEETRRPSRRALIGWGGAGIALGAVAAGGAVALTGAGAGTADAAGAGGAV
ncbi:deferrochelatase/peroxidase EfeB, partial [Streptomyces sp. SID685]|nr:deferrochelatase/peroxidase EfeB [Streptomyces sp. SID685]